MGGPHRELVEHWVGDYCTSTAFREHASAVREFAPEILVAFLEGACGARDLAPADLEEADMKPGLLHGVAPLDLPDSVRDGVVDLCAGFLGAMEETGRLGGGRSMGLVVRALRTPFREAASGKPQPFVAPAAKVGRNDPCPCGSGRKYKKCCRTALD